MIPASDSTLCITLPDPYQCSPIRGTHYTMPLAPSPPPSTQSRDERKGTSAGRETVPSLCLDPWRGQHSFRPDYEYPANGTFCVMATISNIQMENGHLSRITKLVSIPPSLLPFFPLFLYCLSMVHLLRAGPCAKC